MARTLVLVGCFAVVALLATLQVIAMRSGFQGPIHGLISDYIATPKSASVPWAGLAIALVGVNNRRRLIAAGAAIGIDAVFLAERGLRGGVLTVGNGPMIVLTVLAVVAGLRWTGRERSTALGAAALGALLIVATKVGDAWLQITVMARPTVLDHYAQLSDRALGNPSWVMGQVVDALGPIGYGILHWVYIELPVAAIAVAIWQLRNVTRAEWPNHYLVRTFLVLGLLGPIVYVLFPVVGPMFAFGNGGQGFQAGNFWPNVVPELSLRPTAMPFDDFTPRNCMPSMHTAWALALFIHSRRGPAWLRYGGTFWLLCTLTATLGFGYHYGVDLVAGAVLCLTVESALREPERGWGWFRIRLVGGGFFTLVALLLSYRFLAVEIAQYAEFAGPLIVGALLAVATAFYATFFARPGSVLGEWGRPTDHYAAVGISAKA
nr:phosphatase PAP2 family protein [Spelaeibacter cavernicola]